MDKIIKPNHLIVLAGWSDFPRLVVEGAHAAGIKRVSVIGFKGSTLKATCKAADDAQLISLGSLDLLEEIMRATGGSKMVMAGQINPLALFRAHFDQRAKSELANLKVRNAHTIFQRFIAIIESFGIEVLPSSLFMRDHIPHAGVLTARAPDAREQHDIEYGNTVAMGVCNMDIGQTIVVKDGVVLAVEGFDGTNVTIKRGGKLVKRGGVVIKVAKENHDMRFDIPVIGTRTIKTMQRAGISALSVQAGRTLMIDLPNVIQAADRAGIAITAVDSQLTPAPTL